MLFLFDLLCCSVKPDQSSYRFTGTEDAYTTRETETPFLLEAIPEELLGRMVSYLGCATEFHCCEVNHLQLTVYN